VQRSRERLLYCPSSHSIPDLLQRLLQLLDFEVLLDIGVVQGV
jgi:hypothetical protein